MNDSRDFPYVRATVVLVAAAVFPCLINLTSFTPLGDVNQIVRGITVGIWSVMRDPANLKYHWFRPLPVLICRMDGYFWGAKAGGYRLTNILLFSGCGLLVWAIARKILPPWPAWLTGLIYVIHPIQVGTVVWLSGREDLVPGLFLFGSASLLINRRGALNGIAGHALYLLALFSKEIAALFPAALLSGELACGVSTKQAMRRTLPSGIMASFYVVLRILFGYIPGRHEFSYWAVMQSPVAMIRDALSLLLNILYIFIPILHPLDVLGKKFPHEPTLFKTVFNAQILGIGLYLLLGLLLIGLWSRREIRREQDRRVAWFAAGWFAVFILPTLHVMAMMAGSRYFFTPLLGGIIFLVWAGLNTLRRSAPRRRRLVIVLFITLCLAMNIREQLRWKEAAVMSEQVLWAAIGCAKKLPKGAIMKVYDLPEETPGGRLVFPKFDAFSFPVSAKLYGNVAIMVIPGPGPDCEGGVVRCVSGQELLALGKR